jgi:Cd2+/Zn2+-exporting ATPase
MNFSQEHGDVIAAVLCAILLGLGWLALHMNWVGIALPEAIHPAPRFA